MNASLMGAGSMGGRGSDACGRRACSLVVLAALVVIACLGLVWSRHGVAIPASGARIDPPRHRIDLSTAPVAELGLLPEIGPSLAARIVADRAARGPFGSVDDLARVDGLGAARIEALREDARASPELRRER